jgi:hypothetical protein
VRRLGRGEDERREPPTVIGLGREVGRADPFEFCPSPVEARERALDEGGAGVERTDVEVVDGAAGVARLEQFGNRGRREPITAPRSGRAT